MGVFFVFRNLVRFVEGFGLVLIKIRSTDKRVGFGARLCFFVLGFD